MLDVSFEIPGNPPLEGILSSPASRTSGGIVVVAPPHPMMGGHSSNPVVQAIVSGTVAARYRALAFNFRGVGESGGDPSPDPSDADADFRAALAAARGAPPLVAAGYSFGAAAAIRAATAELRIRAVVAVAPPAVLIADSLPEHLGGNLTIIAAERDHFAPAEALADVARRIGARFEIVAGADHFFGVGLARVTELTEQALRAVG